MLTPIDTVRSVAATLTLLAPLEEDPDLGHSIRSFAEELRTATSGKRKKLVPLPLWDLEQQGGARNVIRQCVRKMGAEGKRIRDALNRFEAACRAAGA